ncbi:hypothetical protein [Streptomyces sp. NPDC058657]|uniref:hypothetical protein n=1 Tax=unclassified Streptomyces TaxID=2593676 RepID=UPI0036652653
MDEIVVQRPRTEGGRRLYLWGRDAGVAYSDRDLVEQLRQVGLDETAAEGLVDGDSAAIVWEDGAPYEYGGAV